VGKGLVPQVFDYTSLSNVHIKFSSVFFSIHLTIIHLNEQQRWHSNFKHVSERLAGQSQLVEEFQHLHVAFPWFKQKQVIFNKEIFMAAPARLPMGHHHSF
jgi:hypothetical protein